VCEALAIGSEPPSPTQIITGTMCTDFGSDLGSVRAQADVRVEHHRVVERADDPVDTWGTIVQVGLGRSFNSHGMEGWSEEPTPMTDDTPLKADDLLISVYLDTSALLDLLATIEDGFTLVERVTSGQSSGLSSERSVAGEISSPGILNLFKVGLSGKLGRTKTEGSNESSEAELTHTYGSLLNRLRRYLVTDNLVVSAGASSASSFEVGSFVEFTGVVRPNPFTASFQQLQRMLGFYEIVLGMEGKHPTGGAPKAGGKGAQRPSAGNAQQRELKAMTDFFEQLTRDVEREGTSTVVFEQGDGGYSAVLTLFDAFLRDRSMSELLNREFRVLGKVARHLPAGSRESVDLLASSGVAGFPAELLETLTEAVRSMSGPGGARVAVPRASIDPPVIEIVPIAIYL
jgi:hypothetical protein